MGFDAIIFDMDGLMVDTEPLWVEAQITVLSRYGVPMTKEFCAQTTGLRIDEVVSLWKERYPWSGASVEEVAETIVTQVISLVSQRGTLMPGVREALFLSSEQGVPLALASSSPMRLIHHVLAHFALDKYFSFTPCKNQRTQHLIEPHQLSIIQISNLDQILCGNG